MQLRRIADHRRITGLEPLFPAGCRRAARPRCSSSVSSMTDWTFTRRAVAEAAAAEAENAIDQHLGALGRVHDIVQVAAQRAVWRRLLLREFAVAQDRAEYVVEIVGDAAGQGTDRLHLLRLPQLRLEPFPVDCACFWAVTSMADPTNRYGLPACIAQTPAAREQPMPVAVG